MGATGSISTARWDEPEHEHHREEPASAQAPPRARRPLRRGGGDDVRRDPLRVVRRAARSRPPPLRRLCPALVPSLPAARDTAATIRKLQAELRAQPDDAGSLTLLGLEYEQRARETGDPSYYSKADGVLNDALGLAPRSPLTESGLGSLALSRHLFGEGLRWGRRAIADGEAAHVPNAIQSRSYGVAGDALVELGRYGEAFAAFDRMTQLEPGLAAYTARLLRPGAPRPPARRARADGRRRQRGRKPNRSRKRGRAYSWGSSTGGRDGSTRPSGSTGSRSPPSPATSTRSTPWRWCGPRGDTSPRDPARAPRRRAHPAAAVRLDARRSLPAGQGTERPPRANTR